MARHHVSLKRTGAILVAVVGLVAAAIAVAAANESSKSKGAPVGSSPAGAAPTCHAWAAATARGADKLGEQAWRDFTIKALAQSCSAIPEQLRRSAVQIRGVKTPSERARILASAASATLGEGCAVAEPLADARKLAGTCPLPSHLPSHFPYQLADAELRDIRAVDYVIIVAMLRSLTAANQFDESAERVILNFTLSAQITGEDFREREERRNHRSR
jgi:hypothetical protein